MMCKFFSLYSFRTHRSSKSENFQRKINKPHKQLQLSQKFYWTPDQGSYQDGYHQTENQKTKRKIKIGLSIQYGNAKQRDEQ